MPAFPLWTFPIFGYLVGVQTLEDKLAGALALNQVTIPDLWQQEAIQALRAGKDVIVQAPTGAGKTLIFELWSNQGKPRGQAIYTVPTRALANDKLAEWRARGWEVGIATGDLSENLAAPVIVATLETQKNRLIAGDGPSLLVVDEYQMISDSDRGLNYELALALAPSRTQLLLLSGSVSNPQDVAKWLTRLGRDAVVVRHEQRPVPLDEVFALSLNFHVPPQIKTYWARLVACALADGLGPILIFAPRRQAAEALASELARQLPTPDPLMLRPDQKQLVGEHLAKLLNSRIAYHHSGLSYGARAGVVEPLTKAGQLRVVVATMGLAAGINFSLRSVALAAESYRRDYVEQPLRPHEILQMFGRAGRRGIDEIGYVLVTPNEIRLREAYPVYLSRSGLVDWSTLLGIMSAAADQGREPFAEAVKIQERLFTGKPIFLGVEESLKHRDVPCGLMTDAERARHVGQRVREILNSRGEWERATPPREVPVRDIKVGQAFRLSRTEPRAPESPGLPLAAAGVGSAAQVSPTEPPALRSILTEPAALEKVGQGTLVAVGEENGHKIYGRAMAVAEVLNDHRVLLGKWIRRLTNWNGRQAPRELWDAKIAPLVAKKFGESRMPVVRFEQHDLKIVALVSLAEHTLRAFVDQQGVAWWHPVEREVLADDCARCSLVNTCRNLSRATGVAMLWRRLGLVDASGAPTVRGRIVSFFSQGYGLAIAAALEDERYPLDVLIYDLANLDASFRFCGDDNQYGGRLPIACHHLYGLQSIPGYLENGVPPHYGAGAELIVGAVHKNPLSKKSWMTPLVGEGDIDRVIIEWRSLLRQIAHAPRLDWSRWTALQAMAKGILHETESPTQTELPPLEYHQSKRIEHRLILRRH